MKYLHDLVIILVLAVSLSACSDFLQPATPQTKTLESIESVSTLRGLLVGAYDRLSQSSFYGTHVILFGDIRTGNAFSTGATGRYRDKSMFLVLPTEVEGVWESGYETIANLNLAINSDINGEGTPPSKEVKYIKGKAYALRAFVHMTLLQIFGQQYVNGSDMGIPYVTTFGKKDKFNPDRLSVKATWEKIGADFNKAIELMDSSVVGPSTNMSYYGALALQARYYMFVEKYAKAAAAAKEVINSGIYSLVPASEYLAAWGTDGQPAFIFGISLTQTDNPGLLSQLVRDTNFGDVEITKELYDIFGNNDIRKELYTAINKEARIHYRVSGKYPTRYTNIPVIRYAEVILIYAEAQYRLGNKDVALKYLNKIPKHRNTSTYKKATLNNIFLERRKELAMEGRYYWRLMRTKKDIIRKELNISSLEITIPFGTFRLAYPIPAHEVRANSNIKQNKGY